MGFDIVPDASHFLVAEFQIFPSEMHKRQVFVTGAWVEEAGGGVGVVAKIVLVLPAAVLLKAAAADVGATPVEVEVEVELEEVEGV
jgi:hypothetical protein